MVGYKVKKKDLHYYRCLKCKGVSLNAHTTTRSKKKSAEAIFLELLQQFELPKKFKPLIEIQLTKLFKHYNENKDSADTQLEIQHDALQKQVKELKIRLGLGKIDQETYQLTFEHLNEQIIKISKEMNNGKVKISNLGNLLKNALGKLENISKIWVSAALEEKKVLQKTLFPEGIYYDMKNNRYLTRKTNQFIELVTCISSSCEGIKKEDLQYKIEKSSLVSGSRLELPSAAADMNPLLRSKRLYEFSPNSGL